MRKQFLSTAIALLVTALALQSAHAQQWYWAHKFEDITGPANAAFTNAVIEVKGMAELGNDHYFTGRFKGTVEFTDFQGDRATVTSLGTNYDAFVARYNSSGNLVWFYRAGSEYGDDQGNDIIAISPGYVLVTGYIGEGDNVSTTASFTGLDPVSGSAVTTTTTPIYSNGNKKAFIAKYSYVGPLAWVGGLDNNASTCSVESEGTGITANYGTSLNFFVTGYFKGDVTISGNNISSTGSCQYNTYVIDVITGGTTFGVNQIAQFEAPTGWNKGKDIICSAPAQPNWSTSLYVVGDFAGDMNCPGKPLCAPPVLSNSNQAQNGYIVRLIPGNLNIVQQGSVCTPSYHAEKLYLQSVDYNGNNTTTGDETVIMKSVAVAENPPRPVAVGEWYEASGYAMTADLIIDGTGISITNSNPYFKDGFIAQYPGTLLYGNWVGSVAGPFDDEVNDVAVNTANNIFFTGNFYWNADVNVAGGSTAKTINADGGYADQDIYVAKYDVNGQYVYAQHLMGGCGSTAEYGTAVSVQKSFSYSDGGFFGGHYGNSIGFNENHPSSELVHTASNASSFYGEHMWDECTGPFVAPALFPPSGPALEFSVVKLSATVYRIDYYLPPGQYMVAYRDPTTSKPHACIDYPNFTSPGWNLHPFTQLSFGTGFQNITVPSAGVVYDWYIQGQCNGRWAAIDPNNNISLKPGRLDIESTALGDIIMETFPNPFTRELTVKLNLPQANSVSVRVLDITGKEIIRQDEREYTAGLQNISMNTSMLSGGLYTVILTTEDNVYTRKIVCTN